MDIKQSWDSDDFDKMSWSNCRLYAMTFPDESFKIHFDIDYVYQWSVEKDFLVGKCQWTFNDVSNLKIEIDFGQSMLLSIIDVERSNTYLSPNGRVMLRDYKINFDEGLISFVSSGFIMKSLTSPLSSLKMDLGRNDVLINLR